MNSQRKLRGASCFLLGGILALWGAQAALAQVSPAEILNPQLKAAEEAYFPRLKALQRAIGSTKFPFPFVLSRYVGLDPDKQAEADSRGLEFVLFHSRVVLKTTGNYNAAYNAELLTQNQRADRVFHEVVVPILQLVSKELPTDVTCEAIGFEISYHVRRQTRNSDYEGKEILVVVFDREDAFADFSASGEREWQEILNRSEVYLNGKEFGLALGEREPRDVVALRREAAQQPAKAPSGSGVRLSTLGQELPPGFRKSDTPPSVGATPASPAPTAASGYDKPETSAARVPAATPADAERLQAKYQSQLDALAKAGLLKFHFVEYSPPSFVLFQNGIVLQLTLRNSLHFERETSSIYKRAAQSFDLFLAPQLKALLEAIPENAEIQALDITLLNQLAAKPNPSSEALEFICPLKLLRQFVDAGITNQELLNQSVILVNGVRIALNLQLVE